MKNLPLKFYGFAMMFFVINAFTQTDSSGPVRKSIVDSVQIYKEGMKKHQFFSLARIRIFDNRKRISDSTKGIDTVQRDTLLLNYKP